MSNGGREEAAVVTTEISSQGKQSLKITDGPDLTPPYNPHFVYTPGHHLGVTRVTFDLRVEAAADVAHEWRNVSGTPYRVGPTIRVKDGILSTNGRKLMEIPPLQWVHVEIQAELGAHSPAVWSLRVSVPGQAARLFDGLAFVHSDAKSLEWLGFSSPGTAPASYWIDEIDISNKTQ